MWDVNYQRNACVLNGGLCGAVRDECALDREARFGGNAAGFDLTKWRHEPSESSLGLNDAPSRLTASGTPVMK